MVANPIQKARVVQVLQWYDRPELVLLEGPDLEYTLAVRSGDLSSGPETYVGGAMSKKRLRDYANGKCDLRFAIAHANRRHFWKFEFDGASEYVTMYHIKRSDPELTMSIPDQGLFARDHLPIDIVKSYVPNTVEQFSIDGSWDLGEFANLYGQIEDIYYITADIEKYDDPDTTPEEKLVIGNAFDRSWDGGGSYVAMYRQVANDNEYHAPLRVSGIQYNSPGHVKIYANKEPFDNLMEMLQVFADNETEIRKAYHALGSFMTANKLKSSGSAALAITDQTRAGLDHYCRNLATFMPGVSFDTLREMTSNNMIVAAKVLASIFRRIERLFKFFDEGRVSHSDLRIP